MSQRLLLGITGGIAAYKAPEMVRQFVKKGFEVRVMLSEAAKAFVTSASLQAVSQHPVYDTMWDTSEPSMMRHIELARWADILLIAPLTANKMAAMAHGMADDLISTVVLATKAPIVVAPAMNQKMWAHPATQENLQKLKAYGVSVLGPDFGEQACGDLGEGRMLSPEILVEKVLHRGPSEDIFQGKHIMVTAGPTVEAIDPVRYLSNRSSGKMGYALAEKARQLGAKVTLVSGPTTLSIPEGVSCHQVTSALDMYEAVMAHIQDVDIFIGAAAVSDFRAMTEQTSKIKKNGQSEFMLTLTENPDILKAVSELPSRPICVGFAAESDNIEAHALEKLQRKDLDFIILNDICHQGIGFDSDDNAVTMYTKTQEKHIIEKKSKKMVAIDILQKIREYMDAKD